MEKTREYNICFLGPDHRSHLAAASNGVKSSLSILLPKTPNRLALCCLIDPLPIERMAEVILVPVAKQILGKLGSLALDQIALVCSLRNELEKLKGTVSTIQAVLRDAEEKQGHNHQITVWLEKLSDVMYDADDLLDDFSTETRRQKAAEADTTATSCWSVVCFVVCFPKRFLYEHGMARAIRAIREKLDDIKNDREFHLEELAEEQAVPLETDPCPPKIVVGREADRDEIVQLLVHSDCESDISVVTIVGMGGLGKTTLAQLVFKHEAVKARFDLTVWVYVSQSFNVKAILEKMLQSMTGESQTGLQLAVLQEKLCGKIRAKRFLVVLDDVWEESARSWEDLAKYLMVGAVGSKVLVTTRSSKVAELGSEILKSETSSKVVMPYFLEGLSEDESWDLLVRKALRGEAQQSLDVERTGREILKKCCGVPLAVSTIAGLLSSRDPKSEWPLLLHDELSNTSREENHIMSTLRLSFNHLPSKMKHCFSYCKLFGKGDDLDVRSLVQLWMAQGYVESDDEGLGCFKTLFWRSFFHEVNLDALGNIWTCKMHDLMHDLASSTVGEKIERLDMSSILQSVSSKTRHLELFGFPYNDVGNDDGDYGLMGDVSKIRTLMSYSSYSRKDCGRALRKFKHVRALKMFIKDSNRSEILRALGELKHLRFLALGSRRLDRVPNTITKLLNLQVLDLSRCFPVYELPRGIRKLVDLKHIYLYEDTTLTHMPKGIGELTSLQTLTVFAVGHKGDETTTNGAAAGLDELRGLNFLGGELKIRTLAHAKPVSSYVLNNKFLLQSLILQWTLNNYANVAHSAEDEEMLEMLCPHPNLKKLVVINYKGANLPNWLSTMTNLVEFTLTGCTKCEYLPPLHLLCPSLKKLCIKYCTKLQGIRDNCRYPYELEWKQQGAYVSDDDAEDNYGFPYFPALSRLEIVLCPKLDRMPLFPTVDAELELYGCSERLLLRTMMMNLSRLVRPPLSQLSSLLLWEIYDLKYLPEEGVCNLTSLQYLGIRDCPRLATLPPAMRCLTRLQKLSIQECPLLKQRCREGVGEDWPNISHIPSVELRD